MSDPADRSQVTDADLRLLDGTAARAAVRLVRERSWALAVLGVVALSVAFVLLGRWQWHRHEAKVERRDQVAATYDATPVPLTDVLATSRSALHADRQWTPVRVTGQYDVAQTLLVRNRPYDGEYGYEVLVPLRLADGRTLVVDRGWLPAGRSASTRPAVPAPPPGTVEVVVRLRPGEPADGRRPPAGQLLRIDLGQVSTAVGGPVLQAYGVLAAERPRPADAPRLLPRPDTGLGPHLAYAVNWWAFAVAGYGLLGYAGLREVQNRRLGTRGITAQQVAAARTSRSRRRTARDEDWEDAVAGGA